MSNLVEKVQDPVFVGFYRDKVVVVRESGHVIERELANDMPCLDKLDKPEESDDDFQPGDSA